MLVTIFPQIESLQINKTLEDSTELSFVEDAAYEFVGGGMLANGI